MKKLFFSLLLLCSVTAVVKAQVTNEPNPMAHTPATQPENNAYWYYPSQNVYYSDMAKSYWYWDKASATWVQGVQLVNPYTPVTDADAHYKVEYKGNEVWKSNADHKTKYPVPNKPAAQNRMKPSGN